MIRLAPTPWAGINGKPRASGDDPPAFNRLLRGGCKPRASGDDPVLVLHRLSDTE